MNNYILVIVGSCWDDGPSFGSSNGSPPGCSAPASHEVISVSHGWDMFLFSPSMGTISELLQDRSVLVGRKGWDSQNLDDAHLIQDDLGWFSMVYIYKISLISIQHTCMQILAWS